MLTSLRLLNNWRAPDANYPQFYLLYVHPVVIKNNRATEAVILLIFTLLFPPYLLLI